MSDAPIISPVGGGMWRLTEPWDGIPAGFVTDGGSIPRFLWRVLGPPIDADTVAAYIRHDWNYQTGRVKRKAADAKLYADLRASGVGIIRANIIYAGVRAFGGSHYLTDRDASQASTETEKEDADE